MGFLDRIVEKQKECNEEIRLKLDGKNKNKLGEFSLDSDKEEIENIKEMLDEEGEVCNLLISGLNNNRNWIIAITNYRMILVRKKINRELEQKVFNIDNIKQVIVKKGMILSKLDITLESKNILIENINNQYLDMLIENLDSKKIMTEKEVKQKNKTNLKVEKMNEFERIMATNPNVSVNRNIEVKIEPQVSKRKQEKQYQKERLNQLKKDHIPYCPKCKSTSLTFQNKKLSVGRAAVGGVLAGPVGLAVGGLTSKKGKVMCMNCGHKWKL